MDKNLINAMAILDGQEGSYAYCNEGGRCHFHLTKSCFPQMLGEEGGYVISSPDSLPMLTDNAPVMAIKLHSRKDLIVYNKSDLYSLAKNLLQKANDGQNLPTYRVNIGSLSFLAIRIFTMSTTVLPEKMADLLFSEWENYPTDYQILEKR